MVLDRYKQKIVNNERKIEENEGNTEMRRKWAKGWENREDTNREEKFNFFSMHHCWQTSLAERKRDKWFSRKRHYTYRHFNRKWQHETHTQWWNTTTDRTTLAQNAKRTKNDNSENTFSYYISCCIPMTSHTTRILYNTCFEYWKSSTYKLIGSFLFSECHVFFLVGCRSRQARCKNVRNKIFFEHLFFCTSPIVHAPLSFLIYFNEVILFTI